MWPVDQFFCLGILGGLTVIDIRHRCVPAVILAGIGLGAALYQLFTRRTDGWLILGGILTGLGFMLLSRLTREGLGYGDSLLILILGIYLGLWRLLAVLGTAFFLLLLVDLPLLAARQMSRTLRLPFYPFLTIGCLTLFLAEGGIL